MNSFPVSKKLFLWLTKPQHNGSHASGYIYGYANNMSTTKPTIILKLRQRSLPQSRQRLYKATYMVMLMDMSTTMFMATLYDYVHNDTSRVCP